MTRIGAGIVAIVAALGLAACQVEQEQEGELPEIEVENGQLPEYDVEPAEVEVTPDTQEVVVPDVDIDPPDDTAERRENPR